MTGRAWRIDRDGDGTRAELVPWSLDDAVGPVAIEVSHSALNFKDALAVTGEGRICRRLPCVAGIDAAGTIRRAGGGWGEGDPAFVTGWGLGEDRDGGLASYCGVEEDWPLAIPEGWDAASIMALGTAGLTAMQGLIELERCEVTPERGPVAVTGASGGVGSLAVRLLAAAGFEVHAVTGKHAQPRVAEFLRGIGAAEIVPRDGFTGGAGKALERERYAGAIDCTGGEPLAACLRRCLPYGAVAACGVAAGPGLPATVFPFILRGVRLMGLSSVRYPADRRRVAWERLCATLTPNDLADSTTTIPTEAVADRAASMIAGETSGRTVVEVGREG